MSTQEGIQGSAQGRSPTQPRQASPHDVMGVGAAFSLAGLYFMLGSAGYLPMPEANAPWFIAFAAGAAFLFAGLTCFVRARAGLADQESDLPEGAPRALRVSYRLLAVGAAGSLAIIGTWVAIGSGPRAFTLATPFETRTTGEMVGRAVFALGVTILWILVFALAVGAVRALFDRRA
jgi:hypothetical protein